MNISKLIKISSSEFQQFSALEKFRACISEPERYERLLNDAEQKQYDKLVKVFNLTYKEISQKNAIKIVNEQIAGAEDWKTANKLIKDAMSLMGPFLEWNKTARRYATVERLYSYAEALEEKEQYADAAKILIEAAKLQKFDEEEGIGIDWDSVQIPASNYSSDPKILDAAFTESEEVDDE